MIYKKVFCLLVFFFLVFSCSWAAGPGSAALSDDEKESDQQIGDFSLAGYGEKGKKTWDLFGKEANIFEDVVKLKDLTGNLYGNQSVKLTADKGDFNKTNGKIHVEKNVTISTSQGVRLTTDSLDWDRVNSSISTKAYVNISKDNLFTRAKGAYGETALNKMNLEKDVLVEILSPKDPNKPEEIDNSKSVIITCDGPLEIDYAKNVAVFNNNVKVDRQDSQIYSDTMEIYFSSDKKKAPENSVKDPMADSMFANTSIDKIIAKGNVKTVREKNITYSREAVYSGQDKKLALSGRPQLLIYSTSDMPAFEQAQD
ncbi:MAG: LPS export ABC transporter periplasmic protein LptC [Candidatus Omnitrophica bacterium]|nr:LPS export ABC transporter periplasmic protein LptC [Candidatus Omnitrophota bacterium]MDD5652798.1 LPS export ABC transporter periplasmic protein LptC [Candidatus Omnitrophota bacterium]